MCCPGVVLFLEHLSPLICNFLSPVFGTDLTTVVLLDEKTVPSFLSMCITELESNALDTEGLYRVPGQTSHILELKEKANHGKILNFMIIKSLPLCVHIHVHIHVHVQNVHVHFFITSGIFLSFFLFFLSTSPVTSCTFSKSEWLL